jgi:hypothetical protein
MKQSGKPPLFLVFSKSFSHGAKYRLGGKAMIDKILIF